MLVKTQTLPVVCSFKVEKQFRGFLFEFENSLSLATGVGSDCASRGGVWMLEKALRSPRVFPMNVAREIVTAGWPAHFHQGVWPPASVSRHPFLDSF